MSNALNIIAIDPGTTHSAIVSMLYDPSADKPIELLLVNAEADNWEIRKALYEIRARCTMAKESRITETGVRVVVILEMIASYGMAVGRETFDTVRWIGRFEETLAGHVDYHLMYRARVKMALCGQMKAKDAEIAQRLRDMLGEPGVKKSPGVTYGVSKHAWQALALAVTHLIETKLYYPPEMQTCLSPTTHPQTAMM